ncbi:methyl-accepting chemotaxis protein [Lawsonia intracellularis]|uniref:methyl-accepting chemotaxis protein n=1 Tax=Lawsonia intracellularis TaxID=29546 RepID=UPI0021E571A2|nr:methyl-accepting chemotaxis protein [Lawsonia intracellularis]UYH53566.1 methyl-accepting chemotaxis protein [Lawsonia intracellularis]
MSLCFSFLLLSASLMVTSCLLIYIPPSKIMLMGISTYLMIISFILIGVIIQKCLRPINKLIQDINKSLSKTKIPSLNYYTCKNEMHILKQTTFELIKQFQNLKHELSITKETQKQHEIELSTIISSSKINEQKMAAKITHLETLPDKAVNVTKHAQEILCNLTAYLSKCTESVKMQIVKNTPSSISIEDLFTTINQNLECTVTKIQNSYKNSEQDIKNTTHAINSIEHVNINISSLQNIIILLHKRITDILLKLTLLDRVTNQTNLLAINLAVEAGKMGTPGKGFSIIANEVKKLSQQSMSTIKKIEQTLYNIQTQTEHITSVIKKINKYNTTHVNYALTSGKITLNFITTIQNTLKELSSLSDTIKEIAKTRVPLNTTNEEPDSTLKDCALSNTYTTLCELADVLKELDSTLHNTSKHNASKSEPITNHTVLPIPIATNNMHIAE